MDKFPDWASGLLGGTDAGPHPHTLNLALKLARPSRLPLMLVDIATSQPTIQRALNELSFLHFARFLPSWDGAALVVVTEFDGPMKPYVMDFVIALGEVFNKLLSYVEEPPPLPVQEHPDEFWAYVEKWNRVPYGPRSGNSTGNVFPADYDYPVYSAYPTKTVVDITGPRDPDQDGLRPALDRRAAKVEPTDVQGNILHSYRAQRATHLMLQVTDPAQARKWLSGLKVQDDTRLDERQPQVAPLNIAFTHAGMLALLPQRAEHLARFPQAFREGPARRAADNGDRGDSAPATWRFGGPVTRPVHVVLSLYRLPHTEPQHFDQELAALHAGIAGNGLALVHAEQTHALPGHRTYFGYVDGISAPRIAGQKPAKTDRPAMQPASSPGEFLLGKEYDSIYGGPSLADTMPADLAHNGCFGALRLIRQDVAAFHAVTQALATRFHCHPSDAASKLLGRWPSGQPLSLYPQDPGPPPGGPRNDFDYAPNWEYPDEPLDHHGHRCPLDAHIRRTNPRSHRVAGARHTRRLLRRGMPARWTEGEVEHEGLLGLFLCADLERQFEFIQRQWVQGGESGHSDPIAGVRSGTTPFRWSLTQTAHIPPLVQTRGSLYLFFPSLEVLRGLDKLARPEPDLPPMASPPEWHGLERLVRVGARALRRLPPTPAELGLEWLARHVLPTGDVADFVEGLLPAALPDLGNLPALQACELGALSTKFIADPCARYRELRTAGHDFFWEPDHQAFLALRRDDVKRILTDVEHFVQAPSSAKLRGIITLDGDAHKHVQQAFHDSMEEPFKAVSANLAAALDHQWEAPDGPKKHVGATAVQPRGPAAAPRLLGSLKQFDAVRDLGLPVLNRVYWQFFGLPENDRKTCSDYAALAMRQFSQPGPRRAGGQLAGANASARLWLHLLGQLLQALLWDLAPVGTSPYAGTLLGGIAARTRLPLPGFSAGSQRTLDIRTATTSLLQFVLAGHLAPQLLFSSAMRNFLAHEAVPGQSVWAHLATLPVATRGGPLATALDESRRFDPAVTIIQRYTARPVFIGGLNLPADTPVFAVAASANRDGNATPELDRFVWNRQDAPPHFSLGDGDHRCIGEALQQLILPQLLGGIMDRAPAMRLVDPHAVPAWVDNIYFRGLESLPVVI